MAKTNELEELEQIDDEQEDEGNATSPAQTQAPAKPKRKPGKGPSKPLPPWKVILHNDDVNYIGDVIKTIVMLTPLGKPQARQRAREADAAGQSLLLTTHRERAELYQQQFASCRLTVTVEEG